MFFFRSAPIRRRSLRAFAFAAMLAVGNRVLEAMPAAPAGISETGAPSFVVLGPEALGLSTAPIDMHLLPDGRILVVSQHELSFCLLYTSRCV